LLEVMAKINIPPNRKLVCNAGVPEPGQMGGSRAIVHADAYAWPRALHSRFTLR